MGERRKQICNENIIEKVKEVDKTDFGKIDVFRVIEIVYKAKKLVLSGKEIKQIGNKNDYDFVTETDLKISNYLKTQLSKLYPDIFFVTEEELEHRFSERFFIVDPIDGTTNLIRDYKMSSISLAFVENGIVQFGVVFNPFSGELFWAYKDEGSYLFNAKNGIKKLNINEYKSSCIKLCCNSFELNSSIIEFGASTSKKEEAEETFSRGKKIFENCLDLRRICSTAIVLCYIACGRLDGYFEKYIKPWDFAAGMLIVEEAGGVLSTWDDKALPLDKECSIVCAQKNIFKKLKELVK